MNNISQRHTGIVALAFTSLLVIYAILVWPALYGPFLFDDFINLSNLNEISGVLSWENIGHYLGVFVGSPGRPISTLSFLLNDYAWPSDPFGFKYTNLMIHLLNGVLLFGLLRQLVSASKVLPQHLFWPLLAMAAWLFHPLQLSAQMLVVQRMTLLSATFCLAGLWGYVALLQRAERPLGAFAAMAALGTATILAYLSKENGALLPLFALVLNATLLTCLLQTKTKAVQRLVFYACAIPSALLFAALVYLGTRPDAYIVREFDIYSRLITEAHILIDYLKQVFIPHISGAGVYHDDYPIYRTLFGSLSSALYVGLIFICIGAAFVCRKRLPILSFAILWFFAGHLMESTMIPLELYFEHRNYLPLLGPVLALTVAPFLLAPHLRKIGVMLIGVWLLLISLITYVQAPVWGSQALIATFWAKENPMSLRATHELAKYLKDSGQSQQAFDVLMAGYNRGIHAADLPFASLFSACWHSGTSIPDDLMATATHAAKTARFSFGAIAYLGRLEQLASKNKCPAVMSNAQWWQLSGALLGNQKFRHNYDIIHIRRAQNRIKAKDHQTAFTELKAAYQLKPTAFISYEIAGVYLTWNNEQEALNWLNKGLNLKTNWHKSLLGNKAEVRSKELIEIIEAERSARGQK